MKIVYTGGFSVLIQINARKRSPKISKVICDGCDTISKFPKRDNYWVLIPSDTATILTLIALDKRGGTIGTEQVNVLPFPTPIVSFDNFVISDKTLQHIPSEITLSLAESIPLKIGFIVRSWTITINSIKFTGIGRQISTEVQEKFNQLENGIFIIEIEFLSPLGVQNVKDIFEFAL